MKISAQRIPFVQVAAITIGLIAWNANAFAQLGTNASTGSLEFLNNDAIRDSGNDQHPGVATDGAGNWVAIWQTDRITGSNGDLRVGLRWARSSDGGRIWSEPATLLTDGRNSGRDDVAPVLATDRKGNWVAMWVSPGSGSFVQNGIESDVWVARSANNGQTWDEPTQIATPSQDVATGSSPATDVDVTLATDGDAWIALWSSTRDIAGGGGTHPPNDAVLLTSQSFDGGATWTTAGSFTRFDGLGDTAPTLAATDSGRWMAVWSAGGELVFSESANGGLTFSEPTAMSNGEGGANPKVASNITQASASGQWMIAYAKAGEIFVARSSNTDAESIGAKRTWIAPRLIGAGVNPTLAAGTDDSWLVGWEQAGAFGDDIDILVSRSRDGGNTWDDPSLLDSDADQDSAEDLGIQLTSDGQGSWLGVWYSGNQKNGAGNDEDLFVLPFAFSSDCDGDGVGDPQQARLGDCDNDGLPDDCDDDTCPTNGAGGQGETGSGNGAQTRGPGCGAGVAGMIPLMLAGLGSFKVNPRRRSRRRHSERLNSAGRRVDLRA